MLTITDFITDLIGTLFNFIKIFSESIVRGFQFILNFFTTVPNFIYDSTISQLPPFFRIGFYGVIGILLFTVAIKIWANIKL